MSISFTYLIVIISLSTLCAVQGMNGNQCPLTIPVCKKGDDFCEKKISTFEACVAAKCDSKKITEFNADATLNCYETLCNSFYEPLRDEVIDTFRCLGIDVTVLEKEEDLDYELENLENQFKELSYGKCLAEMMINCKKTSEQCVEQLFNQFQCMQKECNFTLEKMPQDFSVLQQCAVDNCKSDNEQLTKLNKSLVECSLRTPEKKLEESKSSSSTSNSSISSSSVLSGFILALVTFIIF